MSFTDKEIINLVQEELGKCLNVDTNVLNVMLSTQPEKGDYTCNISRYAASFPKDQKVQAPKLAQELVEKLNNSTERRIIKEAVAEKAFINLKVDKGFVFQYVINRVFEMGEKYGSSTRKEPMRVIIEHTSANPNSPLHVGNLRNVMIGAHLSRMLKFVGCDVKEYFYVNDLGGQIGVTALGYSRLKELPSNMKIDHMIGIVYAIMNTFNEAQKNGFKLSEFNEAIKTVVPVDDNNAEENEQEQQKTPEQLAEEKRKDILNTGASLLKRYPELYQKLASSFRDDESVQILGAGLNKAYENRDPEAVKIIRTMTNDTLRGQQMTLDTYNVHHDRFDFESELSWEGTSQALISLFRQSPFFHPQTQCNALGKPEGAYLDLDSYLDATGAKRGKGGYAKPYPNFYVLRPDGTTLYTLRDVAYSMKKIGEADMVLNVICTEQNLPQEKVMLTLKALGVQKRAQFHMAYELVKLSENGKIKRMAGRKGFYILSDTLYDDLRAATRQVMQSREKKHIEDDDETKINHVCNVVASSAMKYSLLSVSNRVKINFILKKL